MSALEEYRAWCKYTVPLSSPERAKADAAIESLKVCGGCVHWDEEGWCEQPEPEGSIHPYENCHFTPSRWERREP